MCLGDLFMTLEHARMIGIFESNPIAREVMRAQSPEILILFKGASIFVGCALLVRLRMARVAELGSWAALAVMTALCIHWQSYSQGLGELTPQYAALSSGAFQCDTWIHWDSKP